MSNKVTVWRQGYEFVTSDGAMWTIAEEFNKYHSANDLIKKANPTGYFHEQDHGLSAFDVILRLKFYANNDYDKAAEMVALPVRHFFKGFPIFPVENDTAIDNTLTDKEKAFVDYLSSPSPMVGITQVIDGVKHYTAFVGAKKSTLNDVLDRLCEKGIVVRFTSGSSNSVASCRLHDDYRRIISNERSQIDTVFDTDEKVYAILNEIEPAIKLAIAKVLQL
jgi:hypothetical protein